MVLLLAARLDLTWEAQANERRKHTSSNLECPPVHFRLGVCPSSAAVDIRDSKIYYPEVHIRHPVTGSHAVYLVLTSNISVACIQLKLTFTMAYLSMLLPHTEFVLLPVDSALPP